MLSVVFDHTENLSTKNWGTTLNYMLITIKNTEKNWLGFEKKNNEIKIKHPSNKQDLSEE